MTKLEIIRVNRDLALCAASDGLIAEGSILFDPKREHYIHDRQSCKEMYYRSRGISEKDGLKKARLEYNNK